jgi:protein SCO1/2
VRLRASLLSLALLAASCASAAAHDVSVSAPKRGAAAVPADLSREEKARQYFTDLTVTTQDGTQHRFFSDILKGKVVLISFFFASCKDACPLINAALGKVQELIGDHLGRDVLIISLTVDPVNDRPAVLKTYAERFAARPGWLFLTGDKQDVQTIAARLGNVAPDPRGHSTTLLIGNVDKARWFKVLTNQPEPAIAARLLSLIDGGSDESG